MKEKIKPGSNRFLIGLGSNLDPEFNIQQALHLLADQVIIIDRSSIYQSPAIGSGGPDYLNSAVLIETDLSMDLLRDQVLSPIENQLGRIRSEDKYMDRTIDLDVLVINQEVTDQELWSRAHIAIPAADILPEFTNPDTGEKMTQAAERLLPGSHIRLRSDLS